MEGETGGEGEEGSRAAIRARRGEWRERWGAAKRTIDLVLSRQCGKFKRRTLHGR